MFCNRALGVCAVSNKLRSKEDLVSIHNGCVCCSLRKDILTALAELSRRSEQANRPYDNIVLETTGLADPAPVAFTFFTNPWAKRRYHLDSIVYGASSKRCNAPRAALLQPTSLPIDPLIRTDSALLCAVLHFCVRESACCSCTQSVHEHCSRGLHWCAGLWWMPGTWTAT